jgi:lipopolysaccharide export system protein LptC
MNWIERTIIFTIVIVLAGITAWMQSDLLEEDVEQDEITAERHDPDYYIENFIAYGMDVDGQRRYRLEADRLVHFPHDDTSLLDNPHVIQYVPDRAPVHTYAESGWVSPNGEEVILTGSVRVIRGRDSTGSGGVSRSDRMRVILKEPISEF